MRLEGKTALVTGGRGGMGRAIVGRFLKEGATVYAADLSPGGSLPEHDEDGSQFLKVDVASEAEVAAALETVRDEVGELDVVVNGAAIKLEKTVAETTLEDWNRIFAVNVTGTFLMSKYALPLLLAAARTKGDASIVNIGSYDGYIADPGLAAYCATKGAVHALTRAMACDHGPEGIRANVICPGYIDTPMLRSFVEDDETDPRGRDVLKWQDAVRAIHPTRRYGAPSDIANLVTWLASDEARYASGQQWVLDGGLTSQVAQPRL